MSMQPFEVAEGGEYIGVCQLSVFLENRLGQLHRLIRILEGADVRILALSIVHSVDCAIVRLLVDDPALAGAAADRVDLLTTLTHEVGHLLGQRDNDEPSDLMNRTVEVGIRRLPAEIGLLITTGANADSRGTDFWLTFPANAGLSQANPELAKQLRASRVEYRGIEETLRLGLDDLRTADAAVRLDQELDRDLTLDTSLPRLVRVRRLGTHHRRRRSVEVGLHEDQLSARVRARQHQWLEL